ncbi:hypothetical protein OW493_10760 [Cobetia sp. 14N.309.X.WAT.E.A4]|uniref:T6SS effector BTH_I2691 family protein n=1 Tax=Cobetia sp. 14N.309.X.WAT.E.A4 TaxID=2998323 RepID=UPI0025AF9515|nr:T6SS effector BTH_I2691 family protein [Cobetia sp. 14N.309.X.WAT.E.A4]MDN2656927.1 hypothetical protein [Cobetia sp. 14N.309.X.WAT.E.A4]
MSADDTTSIANCSFCRGEGLPILPVRYAIARTDSKIPAPRAPVVNGPFGEGVTDVATLPDGQDYTLRLMRAGFLYVYNEAAGTWSGYVVTEKGYLYAYVKEIEHSLLVAMDPANPTQGVSNKLKTPSSKVEFSCAANNSAHQYPGRCITIPDAANADNIYLAFSDTAWTNRVWHEHATNEVVEGTTVKRRDQMRKLSLAEWRSGQASHASSISTISQYVAEASIEELTNKQEQDSTDETGLEFSLDPVNGMADDVDNLVSWADSKSVDDVSAVMIALDDPVGITSDVAMLLNNKLKEFINNPSWQWPLTTAAQINDIEKAVREQAAGQYIKKITDDNVSKHLNMLEARAPNYWSYLGEDAKLQYIEDKKNEAQVEITDEKLMEVSSEAWNDYSKMIGNVTTKNGNNIYKNKKWEEEVYKVKLDKHNNDVMDPLADAYLNWVASSSFLEKLNSSHDDSSIECGVAFSTTVMKCLLDTQQYSKIHDKFTYLLSQKEITSDNWLLRALVLNNKDLKEIVHSALKEGMDAEDTVSLPWSGLISAYQALMESNPGYKDSLGYLLAMVASPYVKALRNVSDKKRLPSFAVLGMLAERQIVKVTVNGTLKDLLPAIRNGMEQANPQFKNVNPDIFDRYIEVATRQSKRASVAKGKGLFEHTVIYDHLMLVENVSDATTSKSLLKLADNAIYTQSQISKMSASQLSGTLWSKLSDRSNSLGVVSLIIGSLTFLAQNKTLKDSASDKESYLLNAKLGAIASGTLGGAADILHSSMQKKAITLNRMQQWSASSFNKVLSFFGKLFGWTAAIVFSALDFISAIDAYKQGKYWTTAAFLLSGVLGMSSYVLVVSTSTATSTLLGVTLTLTGWGLILAAGAIFINILISMFSTNKLQDWLGDSYFGDNADGFNSLESQNSVLNTIFSE